MRCLRQIFVCWWQTALPCLILATLAAQAYSQRRVHSLYHSNMPPGAIGSTQIAQDLSRRGYVQPIQVIVPEGAVVAVASDGDFPVASTDFRAGLLVGQPYRLRITNIPQFESQELYPSVEIIDRLHPPQGQRDRFPIPIEITQRDLELALRGSMVVRVIYLENPELAFPRADGDEQRSLDVLPAEDPLHVADEVGRPMAIFRLGSRVPLDHEVDDEFVFGSPPVEWIDHASNSIVEVPSLMAPVVPSRSLETPRHDAQFPGQESSDPFVDDQLN